MFAKVFSQIFDSSIAQDYTVRHMFMDLLCLADSDGAIDMTLDAVSRRTNVPIETVERCIKELCQPDPASRSPMHEGKRLVPLDSHRDWGWLIVNYAHYRKVRDEESRRAYFRDYQRVRRAKEDVKDKMVTEFNKVESSPSASSSKSSSKEKPKDEDEVIEFCVELGLLKSDGEYFWNKWESDGFTNKGKPMKNWKATIRSWTSAGYCPSQKNGIPRKVRGVKMPDNRPDDVMAACIAMRRPE